MCDENKEKLSPLSIIGLKLVGDFKYVKSLKENLASAKVKIEETELELSTLKANFEVKEQELTILKEELLTSKIDNISSAKEAAYIDKITELDKQLLNSVNKSDFIDMERDLSRQVLQLEMSLEEEQAKSSSLLKKYEKFTASESNNTNTSSLENNKFVKDFLALLSDFDVVVNTSLNNEVTDSTKYVESIEIIHKNFFKLISKHNIEEISDLGKKFDPAVHEVIKLVSLPEKEKDEIIEVISKGYKINDKVIAYAKVIINE